MKSIKVKEGEVFQVIIQNPGWPKNKIMKVTQEVSATISQILIPEKKDKLIEFVVEFIKNGNAT